MLASQELWDREVTRARLVLLGFQEIKGCQDREVSQASQGPREILVGQVLLAPKAQKVTKDLQALPVHKVRLDCLDQLELLGWLVLLDLRARLETLDLLEALDSLEYKEL